MAHSTGQAGRRPAVGLDVEGSKPGDRTQPLVTARPTLPQDRWVARPRLIHLVEEHSPGLLPRVPIVMLSAPAGTGKTVLARQLLAADGRVRLEVDALARLDDPAALARALVDALESIGPATPNLLASITASEPGFSSTMLPGLARAVATRAEPFVMVIDDLHLLENPASQHVVRTVCDALPDDCRLILTSRYVTPVWLSKARAGGRLLEILERDLRFDVDEAAEVFRRVGVPSPDSAAAAVVTDTGGWAVAVYLAAVGLRSERPPLVSSQHGGASTVFISDYIRAELLPQVDDGLRSFLIRTSVLEELDSEVCDAVLLRHDSAQMLRQVQQQLQLVIPTDPPRHRLRYHHLLTEALRAELASRDPEAVAVLHGRAARWYAENGDLDAAIGHAKAGNDLDEVARLVWSGTIGCVTSGDTARLAYWLQDLHEAQIARDPWLSLSSAWLALQNGESDLMDRWTLGCETHAGSGWRDRASLEAYPAALAFLVALVGREGLAQSLSLCEAACDGLPPEEGFRAASSFLRAVALTLTRRTDEGNHWLAEAERLARVLDVPLIQADALSWRGILAMADGDHATAQRLISGARDIIIDNRLERLATSAHCITAQALIQAMRRDPEASTTLATARRLTSLAQDIAPWFEVCGRLLQARAAIALGEGALARQLIREATARMTPELRSTLAQDLLEDAESSLALLRPDGAYTPALTAAEMRVLQFLPSHLQLTQIGEHLFVTHNTVKTHIRSIHSKLGVSSRGQAVARARELGLLETPAYD